MGGVCYYIHHEKEGCCLKKYKIYKHCNKSILTKHLANVTGLNSLYDGKLFWSLWVSNVGIGVVKLSTGVIDDNLVNSIHFLVKTALWGEIFLGAYDLNRKISSEKKLIELSNVLDEKGISFDLTGTKDEVDLNQVEDLEHNVIVTIKNSDDSKIVSKNDDVIIYYDADKQIDITDDVKRALLNKRQYKKYCNNCK